MRLSDFKRQLAETEATMELLEERFDPKWDKPKTLKDLIKSHDTYYFIIDRICKWGDTPEGYSWWRRVQYREVLIAPEGEVLPDYMIYKRGPIWVAGCQTIPKKQRLKLFKLLADDLGYEVEN